MKTAISLPDGLFETAENLAHKLHMSRSYLYALALKNFIEQHQKDTVTEALNEIYFKESSKTDPFIDAANNALLSNEAW